MKKILVIGALGQIGSELVPELRKKYGSENVIAAGHVTQPSEEMKAAGPFEFIEVTKRESLERVVKKHDVSAIYHLASILSASGEKDPGLAYFVNNHGLYNVLEVARENGLERGGVPSSIAVFGPDTPRDNTPNETILKPTTMYGISKVHGELLGNYYFKKFAMNL